MKLFFFVIPFVYAVLFTMACSDKKQEVVQGKIVYEVDYPANKNNAFLIRILPDEMTLEFANGIQKSSIRNANLQNLTWVDCNENEMAFYFQYAEDAYKVNLTKSGVNDMLKNMENYSIEFVDEHKKIAGFDCLKAVAHNKASNTHIELWYTKDLNLKNPNWYTPFHEIDGVLMAYEIEQFGLRMSFKAKSYSPLKPGEEERIKQMPAKGNPITFSEYNSKMTNLFSTFD